jgi:hypothetical protein
LPVIDVLRFKQSHRDKYPDRRDEVLRLQFVVDCFDDLGVVFVNGVIFYANLLHHRSTCFRLHLSNASEDHHQLEFPQLDSERILTEAVIDACAQLELLIINNDSPLLFRQAVKLLSQGSGFRTGAFESIDA